MKSKDQELFLNIANHSNITYYYSHFTSFINNHFFLL